MANRPASLKQSEVTRYAKAMRDAGVQAWRLEVEGPDGSRVSLVVGEQDASQTTGANPCDRLLK